MADILLEEGLKEKIESVLGRRRDVLVLACLVMVLLVIALALWARRPAHRIAPPARAAEATSAPVREMVYVHVGGAVRRPGLYEFPAGKRVAHAVEAAKPTSRSDLDGINLAELLVDGAKIEVPRRGQVVAASTPAPGSSASPAGSINVNTADQALLETIPGVGPVTAAAIIDFRTQSGPLTSIDQLLDVTGIGPATLESLRPYVTI